MEGEHTGSFGDSFRIQHRCLPSPLSGRGDESTINLESLLVAWRRWAMSNDSGDRDSGEWPLFPRHH
jgi:hypothetical protein